MRKIKEVSFLFLVFTIFKSLAFIAPLGVNQIFGSLEKFGIFEYSLNVGQTLMGLFSMGFAGTYAYYVIKQNRYELKPVFHAHFVLLSTVLSCLALISPQLLSNLYFGAIVLGLAFADQVFLSAVLKLKEYNKTSIIVDTGVYIVMGTLVLLDLCHVLKFSQPIWIGSVLMTTVLTSAIIHVREARSITSMSKGNFFEVYRYGILIVITGPLIVLLTASTRLYIEYFYSPEDVGMYSFYFRLTSVSLIISRVSIILLYRKMFMGDHEDLDKNYSMLLIVLLVGNVILFLMAPYLLSVFLPLFRETYADYSTLFLLCFFQIIFWVNTSLFEPILQRENKMLKFILVLIVCNLLMIGLVIFLKNTIGLSLNIIVWVNSLVVFFLFLGQQLVLWKNKIVYRRTILVHLVTGILFVCTLFFI